MKPANDVLSKQTTTVPIGEIAKNKPVYGDNIVITPLTKPNIAPTQGPYNKAPKAIGTKDKFILTGPIEI